MNRPLTRRELLQTTSTGFGWLALSALMAERAYAGLADAAGAHFTARVKHVIFCFMDGGVSHVDSFDPKPKLDQLDGQEVRISKEQNATTVGTRKWLKSPWKFQKHGKSGIPVSDLFPYIAGCVDDLCVIRSMKGNVPLHGQSNLLLHTGRLVGGAPSLGSWVSYGLGTLNRNLPGYVLLNNDWIPNGGFANFANAFLPATHQATLLRAKGTPIDNIVPADAGIVQRAKLDLLRRQDPPFARGNDDIESAIQNYETAFRMQALVPDVIDVGKESKATRQLYGIDAANDYQRYYALQCLRARRLVEAGVRFVEITCPLTHANNSPWDQHGELRKRHGENALITDQAVAALVKDLKARGLLDETLVLWAGEFGRTPHASQRDGRDHHPTGYTVWLAGGGVKPGFVYGGTDELGMVAVEDPMDVHDLHATLLHLLGLDHRRLKFRFGGRDVSLTDVHGRVVREILA